jgi:uncharacterized protein YuzE
VPAHFCIAGSSHETELFSRYRLALHRSLSETERGEPEVSEGVVLDYDREGNLVGIDIDHASRKLDLCELVTNHIPLEAEA